MDYFFEARDSDINVSKIQTLDFNAHLHSEVEMGYLIDGSATLYLDDKEYKVKKGEFFVIFPNQIHKYEKSKNISAYVIIFSPDILSELQKVFMCRIPENPVVRENIADAKKLIEFIGELKNSSAPEIYKGLMLSLSAMLFENMKFVKTDKYNVSTLKSLLIFCDEHYTEPINIDDAAEYLHISRSHIAHIFKGKLNTTFGNYINRKRINHACRLLKNSNCSVTEAAFASGFESIRTFNRIFISYTDCSPREYRKREK